MVYQREQQIDDAFFALSHPVRRTILDQLTDTDLSVSQVLQKHQLSAAQMTKHLAILERGGLLARERQGRTHLLKLQPQALQEIMAWVKRYERFWQGRLDALDQFLQSQEEQQP